MYLPEIVDLKKLKEEVGITNYELAKRSGISISTIDDTFSGKTKNPGLLTVKKLMEYLTHAAMEKKKLKSGTKAGEICSTSLKKIKFTETLYHAQKKFEKYPEYTTFPVFKGDKLIGLVTDTSLRIAKEKNPRNWEKLNVRKAMTARPHIVDYLETIENLKNTMKLHRCVLVRNEDGRSILGIITDYDLLMLHPRAST